MFGFGSVWWFEVSQKITNPPLLQPRAEWDQRGEREERGKREGRGGEDKKMAKLEPVFPNFQSEHL